MFSVVRDKCYLLKDGEEFFLGKVTGEPSRGSVMFELRSKYGCGSGMLSLSHVVCEIPEEEYLKADKMVKYYQTVLDKLIRTVADSYQGKKGLNKV